MATVTGTATATFALSFAPSTRYTRTGTATSLFAMGVSARGVVSPAVTAPEWQLDVTGRTGTTYGSFLSTDAASVSPVMAFEGQDPLSDIGTGKLTLPLTHSTNAYLDEDRLLHVSVRGKRVTTMLVKPSDQTLISPSGEAGEVQDWHLETLFGVLAEGDVNAPADVGTTPAAADRIFDSSDPARDNSDFSACAALCTLTYALTGYGVIPYGVGCENPGTVMVIGPAGYGLNDNAPAGDHFCYKDITFAGGYYRVNGTFDNGGELRIDGKTIQPNTVGFGNAYQVSKFYITPGSHRVWCRVQNGGSIGGQGPCTTFVEFVHVDAADNGTLEAYTDSSWKWMTAPAQPPGFTLGRLIRLVMEENQARNSLLNITLTCTDSADSSGVAWSNEWNISTKSWNPVSTFFLKELTDTYCDFRMRWVAGTGIVLDVWHKGGRGQVTPVAINATNSDSVKIEGAPTLATTFVTSWNDANTLWFSRESITPVSGHPVKEQPLTLGAQRSQLEEYRVAQAQLALFGRKRGKTTVSHLVNTSTANTTYPGLAYWTGDTITVPTDSSLTAAPVRVIAMTWQLDKNTGDLNWTPELGDLIIPTDARSSQALRKMAGGTLGGQTRPSGPF